MRHNQQRWDEPRYYSRDQETYDPRESRFREDNWSHEPWGPPRREPDSMRRDRYRFGEESSRYEDDWRQQRRDSYEPEYRNSGREYGYEPRSLRNPYDRGERYDDMYSRSPDYPRYDGRYQDRYGQYGQGQYGQNERGFQSGNGGWDGRQHRQPWSDTPGSRYGGESRQFSSSPYISERYGSSYGSSSYDSQSNRWQGSQRQQGRAPRNYTRSDERIREDVCDRLVDCGVDANNVDVRVDEGEVTFTGTVGDRESRHDAEYIAESVSGVRHVNNQIRVQQPGSKNESTSMSNGSGARTQRSTSSTSTSATESSRQQKS